MTFDTIIRGAEVVSSTHHELADIGIAQGRIVGIGDLNGAPASNVVDATGLLALPGLIDTQVHFREPGLEHKEDIESGSRAAVMGGVTAYFEMPNTAPATTSADALEDKLRRAAGRSWANYAFFLGATDANVDALAGLEVLPGTPGIKIFMGSSTGSLLVPDDDTLRKILRNTRRPCPVHAEDHHRLESRKSLLSVHPHVGEHPFLRDAECARLATARILALAKETGARVHILHVSTADELPLLAVARRDGIATCEITPQHLWFSAPDCYDVLGTRAQMNPPIRDASHREALRHAFYNGQFDVLGSDHAPHTVAEKELPYPKSPSGMPGVQTLLPVMLTLAAQTGRFTIQDIVRMACENPAHLYSVQAKGKIQEGFDADIVLVDPKRRWTVDSRWLQSKCGWSPYEGLDLVGQPIHVFVNGEHTVRETQLFGSPQGRRVEFEH